MKVKAMVLLLVLGYLAGCSEKPVAIIEKTSSHPILYVNGHIYDYASGQEPVAQAMLVQHGVIQGMGTADFLTEKYPNATTVDLKEAHVLPGMIDGHSHPGLMGTFGIDIEEDGASIPATSREKTLEWLREYRNDNLFKPFIFLGEWDVKAFLPNGPSKEELDEIFPYRPVILSDNSGHSFWLNSVALDLFGIDKNTPDLSKNISYFVRDENGEPTGWVKEFALMPYFTDYLMPDHDELKESVASYLAELSAYGVTSLLDAGTFGWEEAVFKVVAELEDEGRLPLRYHAAHHVWDPKQLTTAVDETKRLQKLYNRKDFKIDTIKIHYDGVSELGTAGMLEPFAVGQDDKGGVIFDSIQLAGLIKSANKEGINLHLHSVGDWATREALDAVERVQKEGVRLGIEITLSHLETVSPRDIARFKSLGVHANFTPHWFGGNHFGEAGAVYLGRERAARQQLSGDFHRSGANVTFSNDAVVPAEKYRVSPFLGLEMAITRRDIGRSGLHATDASQGIDRLDGLLAYTLNGARQLGIDSQVGELKPGMAADFILLDRSPFDFEIQQLHKVRPLATYFRGEMVKK